MTEKLVTIFGTRPEIIRLSQLIPKLDENFNHKMINTYQNLDMILNDVFLDELKIRKPDYNLNISHENYGDEVSDIIRQTYKILKEERPDKVLILGDTYSGLSVLASSNLGIKTYHMEAGMRSNDPRMPEERNRRIIDHISSINLPYTYGSKQNLIREGLDPKKIFVIGNPIIDVINSPTNIQLIRSKTYSKYSMSDQYYLITMHRHENVTNEKSVKTIISVAEELALKNNVVFFAHPRLLESIEHFKLKIDPSVKIRKSVGMHDFMNLELHAKCVLSDSGTVPEECTYFQVPSVTLRESTERPELTELGSTIISGTTDVRRILDAVKIMESSKRNWVWDNDWGDGRTSDRVLRILMGDIRY